MEKDRTYRTVSVIALIVAVVALSIGYAAFTASLNITATASVEPENTFTNQIGFNDETPTFDATQSTSGLPTEVTDKIDAGTISGEYNQNWEDIKAVFTQSGQSETFTATVENASDFIAYLNYAELTGDIIIAEDTGNTDWYSSAIYQEHGTDLLTDAMKEKLKNCFNITVKVDGVTIIDTANDIVNYSDTTKAITLDKEDGQATVTVTITYDTTGADVPAIDVPLIIGLKGLTMTWSTYSAFQRGN